jgi:hypothetical protein
VNNKTKSFNACLYAAGAGACVLFILYAVVTIAIFSVITEGYPQNATECFTMIAENRFIALLRLDIVSVVILPFYYVLFFSLYWPLKLENELLATASFVLVVAGTTLFISDVNILAILRLSDKYFSTDSIEYKNQLSAACECLLAQDMWTSANAKIRGIMIETGAVILSVLMVRSNKFIKSAGIIGILAHGFDLTSEIGSIFYPSVKELFKMVGGPLYLIWFVLMIVCFVKLFRQQGSDK